MAFNPFEEKGIPLEDQIKSWSQLNVQPYNKMEVDPYTRTRIILMNGIEVESAIYSHQLARHTADPELKQRLALARRVEQQQEKVVNWLVPADESNLEVTIGYEQVAVDLTAYLAQTEPDPYVKAALDFALLEDFDHLYRYANLLDLDENIPAQRIVGEMTEITPGRPTIAEHRHPFDDVRKPYNSSTADILTKLHVTTIVAGEQQTMNLYMNLGNRYASMVARGLYLEIAQIEEQHVTHYESLADPTMSWFERLLLHDYNEAYMYYSCMETEPDARIRSIWENHLAMELGHIREDLDLMQRFEGRDGRELFPDEFPMITKMQSNKDYVRQVLRDQVYLTSENTEFVPLSQVSQDARYFWYQNRVNDGQGFVPSQAIIEEHVRSKGSDYRFESEGPHPVDEFRTREATPTGIRRA